MDGDPVRERVRDGLRRRGLTLREASLALGRNAAYLHQFLERGSPRALAYPDAAKLAELLGCGPEALRHESVPKRRKSAPRRRRFTPPESPGAPLAGVPELDVAAAAGGGAFNAEAAVEKARWYLPEAMLRHEGGARPEDLRILRVQGDSMEPQLREGDRLLVDVARRTPGTGEMAVLWDGTGLVVKRVEIVSGEDPPRLRLLSANPDYPAYTCLADEAHVVGKVMWTVRRV